MTIPDQFNAAWANREWGVEGVCEEATARRWFERGYREALKAAAQAADMARSKFIASGHIQQAAGAWCAHEEIRALAEKEEG